MVVGGRNHLKGDIKFERFLRIEGTIEGQIIAPANVIADIKVLKLCS